MAFGGSCALLFRLESHSIKSLSHIIFLSSQVSGCTKVTKIKIKTRLLKKKKKKEV